MLACNTKLVRKCVARANLALAMDGHLLLLLHFPGVFRKHERLAANLGLVGGPCSKKMFDAVSESVSSSSSAASA